MRILFRLIVYKIVCINVYMEIVKASSMKQQDGSELTIRKNIYRTRLLELFVRFFMHYVFSDDLFQHRVRVDKNEGSACGCIVGIRY